MAEKEIPKDYKSSDERYAEQTKQNPDPSEGNPFVGAAQRVIQPLEDPAPKDESQSEIKKTHNLLKATAYVAGGAALVSAAAYTTDAALNLIEERAAYNQQQNDEWVQEQQDIERELENNQITIEVSESDKK